jgi:hypothetical protein
MQPYQQRVIQENDELLLKINALNDFLSRDDSTASPEEYTRMTRQLAAMREYAYILAERIEAFV